MFGFKTGTRDRLSKILKILINFTRRVVKNYLKNKKVILSILSVGVGSPSLDHQFSSLELVLILNSVLERTLCGYFFPVSALKPIPNEKTVVFFSAVLGVLQKSGS